MKKRITAALILILLLATLACGWDSTPQYVIATPTPNEAETPPPTEAPTPEPATPTPQSSESPDQTPDGTADAQAVATPDGTVNPSVTATPDPHLVGTWEFKRSRYKGIETPASETGWVMTLRIFDNGSAEANIYKKSTITDPPEATQGVQWRIDGATVTLTLYGETIWTLLYDGTYLIYEQPVFDGTDDFIFERTGDV